MLSNDCYPQEIFLNQNAIKKFLCPIDYGVCRDPVLDICGHSFGKFCINQWVKKKNTCPLTNNEYPQNPAFPDNFAIKDFLNDMKVKCINHDKYCDWEGLLESLDGHLKKDCGLEIISCTNEKCEKKIMRKYLNEHLMNECLYTEIECLFKSKGCDVKLQRYLSIQHLGEVHHQILKEILENYDKNVGQLAKSTPKINEQQLEIDNLHKTHICKEDYYKIVEENDYLKGLNSKLKEEISDLEYKVKETCLKLLDKEKEAKMMESRLVVMSSNINSNHPLQQINNVPSHIINPVNDQFNNNSSNIKTFTKSYTTVDEPIPIIPSKKQHVDPTQLYNYPQMIVYDPITGHDMSQTKHFGSIQPAISTEIKKNYMDLSIYDLSAHENSINFLMILNIAEGKKYMASCSVDKAIKVWDLTNFQLVKVLQGHVDSVTCLIYLKDSYVLISGGNDNTIRLWNVNTWDNLKIIDGKAKIRTLLNYANNSQFVSGGSDNKVKLWGIDKGTYNYENLAILEGEVSVLEIVGYGDINEVLAGDSKGNIYLIKDDPAKKGSYFSSFMNKVAKSLKCHDNKILGLKYIKENTQFASCALTDGKLKIRNKNTFQLITEILICGSGYCINDIKYDNSVNLVIIGTSDERIISISSMDWNIKKTYEKEGYGVNNIECDFKLGCIFSCGALRDKNGNYKYIIRIRKI